MGRELYKIENNVEYPEGYFFIMANPRSGHNFIKNNILSWTNDLNKEKRYYVNMEGHKPSNFDNHTKGIDLSLYPNSVKVLVIRSLLSWFVSYLGLIKIIINKKDIVPPENYDNKIILHNDEFIELLKSNPDIEKDPNVIIIPNDLSKEKFIQQKTEKKDPSSLLNSSLTTWVSIAKEFIGETLYLDGFIKIYYDDFFISQEYRKNICDQIGGVYNEDVLNIVTPEGRYSSFDKDKFQNNAQNMNVLERWKEWNYNKEYADLLKNHDALNFYLNNFNVPEEEQNFINSI